MSTRIGDSSSADLGFVIQWLKDEQEDYRGGFSWNADVIARAHKNGRMQVLRRDGATVAFLANGVTLEGILEVHPKHRGRGYGRELAQHGIQVERSQGTNVLDIQCAPSSSLGFWKHLGFQGLRDNYARMVLETTLPVRREGSPATVAIDYFREGKSETRTRRFAPSAVRDAGGTVHLGQRVVFDNSPWYAGDAVACIRVHGVLIYDSKVKHPEAEKLGVKRDACGVYYLDSLSLMTRTS